MVHLFILLPSVPPPTVRTADLSYIVTLQFTCYCTALLLSAAKREFLSFRSICILWFIKDDEYRRPSHA